MPGNNVSNGGPFPLEPMQVDVANPNEDNENNQAAAMMMEAAAASAPSGAAAAATCDEDGNWIVENPTLDLETYVQGDIIIS